MGFFISAMLSARGRAYLHETEGEPDRVFTRNKISRSRSLSNANYLFLFTVS